MKKYHVIVVFYEMKDEFQNYRNVTKVDLTSTKEDEKEAVKECVARAKELMQTDCITHKGETKDFFYVETIIEQLD